MIRVVFMNFIVIMVLIWFIVVLMDIMSFDGSCGLDSFYGP